MRFRWMMLALLLALAPAAPWAGQLEDGLAAYNTGDYATALRHFRPLAEQGHAKAQFFLGAIYDQGLGVPQDNAEAVKWYRKAAEQGDVKAQNELGWMYEGSRKVPKDYIQAHLWWSLAAAQGDEQAAKNRFIIATRMTPRSDSRGGEAGPRVEAEGEVGAPLRQCQSRALAPGREHRGRGKDDGGGGLTGGFIIHPSSELPRPTD